MPVLVLMGLLFAAGCFLGTVAVWVFPAPVLLAPPDKFTLALSTTSLPVDQRRQNGVQDVIEMFAHVFRQESQDQISVLLQESILSAIPPVGLGRQPGVGLRPIRWPHRRPRKTDRLPSARGRRRVLVIPYSTEIGRRFRAG